MYEGEKVCECGNHFIFQTMRDYVECFQCKKRYVSVEIGEWIEPEPEPEPEPEE